MVFVVKTVDEYIHELTSKGFQFQEDALGFIYFGKHYTNASDEQINTAIELTLKAQKDFDGSFYMSLLETLTNNKIVKREHAYTFVKKKKLIDL